MRDDVQKLIYGVLAGFVILMVVWIAYIYITACGFSLSCKKVSTLPPLTPIPTLIPATMPVPERAAAGEFNKCQIAAVNLIGAWVNAGYPENDPFTFTDVKGRTCQATFYKDVQPLFVESNIWYPGSQGCSSCHHSNLATSLMNMDLSSYAGILAGSRRANSEPKGQDILGGGVWEQSLLYQMLYAPNGQTTIGRPAMPLGRPASVPAEGPLIYAGQVVVVVESQPTPTPTP
ncbi:MAG: hypothetical protein WHS87_03775 [Anaerolineales bacterium]